MNASAFFLMPFFKPTCTWLLPQKALAGWALPTSNFELMLLEKNGFGKIFFIKKQHYYAKFEKPPFFDATKHQYCISACNIH
jgi:hypothetical protein